MSLNRRTAAKRKKKSGKSRSGKLIYLDKKDLYKKESRQVIFVISVSLILFIISIGGSVIKFTLRDKIPVMSVTNGSIDIPEIVKGIIVRDEHIYKSPVKGDINFNIEDNQKVKKGQVVLDIRDKSIIGGLENKEKKLNTTILDIQKQRSNISSYASDVSDIDNKIKSVINNSIYKFINSDMVYIASTKDIINNNINLKNNILLNEDKGLIKDYVNENMKIQEEILKNTFKMKAEKGGIISYKLDGFEDILNFETMYSLSEDQTNMNVNSNFLKNNKSVNIDDPIFKIIESNKWYICAYIPNELIKDWKENATVKVYINKNDIYQPLCMEINKIVFGKKESYVILESTKMLLDYLDFRTISFKTYDSIFCGLKIPKTAVTEITFLKIPKSYVYEDKFGKIIYKKCDGNTEKKYIDIKNLKKNDDSSFYIIQDFNKVFLGDIIVNKNGEEYKIEDIVTEKGIYKVNNGIATFIAIDMDGVVYGENNYMIISVDKNVGKGGLNIYDRIVVDAKNYHIVEGQKIN